MRARRAYLAVSRICCSVCVRACVHASPQCVGSADADDTLNVHTGSPRTRRRVRARHVYQPHVRPRYPSFKQHARIALFAHNMQLRTPLCHVLMGLEILEDSMLKGFAGSEPERQKKPLKGHHYNSSRAGPLRPTPVSSLRGSVTSEDNSRLASDSDDLLLPTPCPSIIGSVASDEEEEEEEDAPEAYTAESSAASVCAASLIIGAAAPSLADVAGSALANGGMPQAFWNQSGNGRAESVELLR